MKPPGKSLTSHHQRANTGYQVPGGNGVAADLPRARLSDSRWGVQSGSCATYT